MKREIFQSQTIAMPERFLFNVTYINVYQQEQREIFKSRNRNLYFSHLKQTPQITCIYATLHHV